MPMSSTSLASLTAGAARQPEQENPMDEIELYWEVLKQELEEQLSHEEQVD